MPANKQTIAGMARSYKIRPNNQRRDRNELPDRV
jgi:hypothetical protein